MSGRRDDSGSTRVSMDKALNLNQNPITTPHTRREGSNDRKIISRVSSRFTDVSKAIETDKYSDSFTSEDGDLEDTTKTQNTDGLKQLSVL